MPGARPVLLASSFLRFPSEPPVLLNKAHRAVRSVRPSCEDIHCEYTRFRPRTKNKATKIATNTTAAMTMPAIAPPLNPPPPPPPLDAAPLVVALAVALEVVEVEPLEFEPPPEELPPSGGGDSPGVNI